MQAALKETLGKFQDEPEFDYFERMWGFVLGGEQQRSAAQTSETCDAIPYVPDELETLCLGQLEGDSELLDIGCYGGYGLYDVYRRLRASGQPLPKATGIDVHSLSVRIAKVMAAEWDAEGRTSYCEASVEALPLSDASVDLVLCRLVLPYVDVRLALAEVLRVMKPGAVALFQIHTPRYYAAHLFGSLKRPRIALYYLKPILTYAWFVLVGRQIPHPALKEMALSLPRLRRLCERGELVPVWSGGYGRRPILAVRKDLQLGEKGEN